MRILAASAIAVCGLSVVALAHDIPNDVVVQAFLKPEGNRLRLLVRVPLQAMRDVDIPKRGPGYLDLTRAESTLRNAATIWLTQEIQLYEEDTRLASPRLQSVRVSLPSDQSFREYELALAHVTGAPLDPATELYWEQGMLDALIEYPIASASSRFSIEHGLRRLGQVVTIGLRLVTPDGAVRAFELHGDTELVRLDPRWHQAALNFAWSGFRHVLDGADHLLFLLCVVIPLRRVRPLVLIVTSFTVAHSITLIASAYGYAPDALWFVPLIETLIAMSIVYMALENIVGGAGLKPGGTGLEAGAGGPPGHAFERRWIVTALFGLVHGFGFSFALRDRLQFAGSHLLTSLLSFNVGVEIAQLLVIAVSCAGVAILFRKVIEERLGTIIISAFVAHTGWHWTAARADVLRQFPWPTFEAAALASLVGWLMVAVTLVGIAWAVRVLVGSRRAATPPRGTGSQSPPYGYGERV